MTKEDSETKRRLLAFVNQADPITAVVRQLNELEVTRVVVESCDQDKQDLQTIGDVLALAGKLDDVIALHMRPSNEPMLWMPDIVAWAYGADKSWRSRIGALSLIEVRV